MTYFGTPAARNILALRFRYSGSLNGDTLWTRDTVNSGASSSMRRAPDAGSSYLRGIYAATFIR